MICLTNKFITIVASDHASEAGGEEDEQQDGDDKVSLYKYLFYLY